MESKSDSRGGRPLALVSGGPPAAHSERCESGGGVQGGRALDWSILMAHAQAGEQEAYRRLLDDITPYLRSLAAKSHRNAADIEDCVQDVLLTVHAIRDAYDPRRPFGPWLKAIAERRIVDRLRRHVRSTAREVPFGEEHETFSAPEANYLSGFATRVLHEAIARLPKGQREAILLLKLREMSLKEAAGASGLSVAALKVATHRAMKRLRRLIVKEDEDGG